MYDDSRTERTVRRGSNADPRPRGRRGFLRTVGAGAALFGAGTAGVAAQSTPTEETSDEAPLAPPANLRVRFREPWSVGLEWDEPEADVDHYEVEWTDARPASERGSAPLEEGGSRVVDTGLSRASPAGLRSGVLYRFDVRAVDVEGNASPAATLEARPTPAPTDPRLVDASDSSITISWTLPWSDWARFPLTAYVVRAGGEELARVDAGTDAVTLQSLDADAALDLEVVGVDADGAETRAARLPISLGESDDATVGTYAAAKLGDDFSADRVADVTVDEDRVRIEGGMEVANTLCRAATIADASLENGVLSVRMSTRSRGTACMPAHTTLEYEAEIAVEDPPEHVLVHTPFRSRPHAWRSDDYDGTVALVPHDRSLAVGDSTELSVRLYGDSLELASYGVTLDNRDDDVLRMEDASFPDGVDGSVSFTDEAGGPRASLTAYADPESLSTTDGSLELCRLSVTAAGGGEGGFDVESASASDPDGGDVPVAGGAAEIAVDGEALPPVGDDENAPTDPDDDGLYEDVNGNGEGDLADAVDLYQHRETEAVTNNTEAYDFSGNDAIDLADVVQLFQENTG